MSLTAKTSRQTPTTRSMPAMRSLTYSIAILLGTAMTPFGTAHAADTGAFDSCDSKAYLTQGHLSRTYSFDLDSGDYQVVAAWHANQTPPPYAWTEKASLDALGYNPNDGFVYGWSHFHRQPVRVHSDWSVEPMDVTDSPSNSLYAGDVSAADNRYYGYSNSEGLYAMDLDPATLPAQIT